MMSRRTVAAVLSVAAVAVAAPGAASAAEQADTGSPTRASSAPTAESPKRKVAPALSGGLHVAPGGASISALQGGSTGDGRLGEEACERLGELAEEAYQNGDRALLEGNEVQFERSYDYANALIEYGLDNGCFFVY